MLSVRHKSLSKEIIVKRMLSSARKAMLMLKMYDGFTVNYPSEGERKREVC